MRYIFFVIDNESPSASGGEIEQIDAFNEALRSGGNWVMAAGIAGPKRATLIDNRVDPIETAGSLFSGPDFYSGFWIIEADDDAAAVGLARRGSKACGRRVELRPFL